MEILEQITDLKRRLSCFARQFDGCFKTAPSRKHMRTYINGQVSNLERKSVEPIALAAGVAPRTLQEFLGLHRWDHEAVRRRLQQIVWRDHAHENSIALIDETSCAKKGAKTAGVQRQWCGSTGKKDNCVVTVHLGYSAGDFHVPVDGDLYLPEETWHSDRCRCREAGIPDEVLYRPKWKIALELLDRAMDSAIEFKYLVADELYGAASSFRRGVAERGLIYVVEVPKSQMGWTKRPSVVAPQDAPPMGRPRTLPRLAKGAKAARRVEKLWQRGGPPWQSFHVKNTGKGPVVWRARRTRFYPREQELPGEECWLIVAHNAITGETKYFVSNACEQTSFEVLLHVAFNRWRIERIFEDGKGQVGFDHFEVRHYLPLMRHLILSMVSLLFLTQQVHRLKKKKPSVEPTSSAHRDRSAA